MPPPRRASLMSYTPSSRRNSSVKTLTVEFDETESPTSGSGCSGGPRPPLDLMDAVPGYEATTFEPACVPAPAEQRLAGGDGGGYPGAEVIRAEVIRAEAVAGGSGSPTRQQRSASAAVTERQARAALLAHVARRSCYGRDAARRHLVTALSHSSAFHYRLETFTERRECSWSYTPFSAALGLGEGELDGGPPPSPWTIAVMPRAAFEAEVRTVRVPHTASVKHCFHCVGLAVTPCHECHAKGWVRCVHCNGDGLSAESDYKERDRCPFCRLSAHGFGRLDCQRCKASGRLACQPCDATGLMLYHIILTVTWKTNTSEFIKKSVSLPEKCLRCVSGEEVLSEVAERIEPLVDFPEEKINEASKELIQNHLNSFADQKILMQRQSVRAIAIAQVQYKWNGHEGQYYVYGKENKVHAPDYPQTCCCGCTVL